MPTGPGSKPVALDFTIIHPLRKELVKHAAESSDYANLYAEKKKENKYLEECTKSGLTFKPISMEIFGKLSPNLNLFVSQIATGITNRFGGSVNYIRKDIERRVMVTLIRCCSKSATSRVTNRLAF